ncbi:MAG: thioesterase family protein [Clostridia bacterium]|jgi:predicted thioesterase|nr:thioesterase family protein [Clostridia bacterium]
MENVLKPGLFYELTEMVTEDHTAIKLGSGTVKVYATPAMIALMEKASWKCVDPYLTEGQVTVGTNLEVKHLTATPVGMKVRARAELRAVEGKRLEFFVQAFDEKEKIGEGIHERYIVNQDKFMARTEEKNK